MSFLGIYLIFLGVSGLFRDLQRYREAKGLDPDKPIDKRYNK